MRLPKLLLAAFAVTVFLGSPLYFYKTDVLAAGTGSTVIDDTALLPGQWVADKEVTFTGKLAARSRDVLNWVIRNYEWSEVGTGNANPFTDIWVRISTIVYTLLFLFILAAAFLIIITRGESITVRRFIPRFVFVLILVYLSFAIVQFIFFVTDLTQGFFLRKVGSNDFIQAEDLLNISWDYQKFKGLRRLSEVGEYDESAIVSLILTKLTAATYFAVFIILTIRKVILWFFLVVSPVFPLLLFFSPIRNTAKIWIGEFFRWVLYAPLFAIFLAGLVQLWSKSVNGVPLALDTSKAGSVPDIVYPTSINILLAGPNQTLSAANSLNLPDTFILYVVALLMIWMVIVIPFILLKIFLDYLNSVSLQDNNVVRYLMNVARPSHPPAPAPPHVTVSPKPTFPPTPSPIKPPGFGFAGMARELPRFTDKPMFIGNYQDKDVIVEALKSANLSIPTIRDISRLEAAMLSSNSITKEQVNKLNESLKRIGGTSKITNQVEKEQFIKIKEKLAQESGAGNAVASSIIEATKMPFSARIPAVNSVQNVNLDDYEEIKKTWEENYKTLEPPADVDGSPRTRKEWLQDEVTRIPKAIELLLSKTQEEENQGKQMVSSILPFLLLGGFSKAEVVAYLKAKLEAAKVELAQIEKEEGEEYVTIEAKKKEEPKTMTLEAEVPKETEDPAGKKESEKNLLGEEAPKYMPDKDKEEPVETVKMGDRDDNKNNP